ncbi:MAG: hypothetical protein HFG26_04670 [Provencibacterium sp.]|jgi:hypothetical protein|nr:hypothetical protein [Provencibacterium sp.]
MKKVLAGWLSAALILCACPVVFAAEKLPAGSSGPGTSGVVVESNDPKDIELHGEIEPTILSVTVPSYIPFSISRSLPRANKVVSPRIEVANHSSVPVSVYVADTKIDLSRLGGATWSENGDVGPNQVAVGLTSAQSEPESLSGAQWLQEGKQETELARLNPEDAGRLFVVGTLGESVPENRSFTVIATLMVHAQ